MRVGLLACTPRQPSVAISIGVLEFYHRLRRHAPRLGVQPFVRALCDKYGAIYLPHLREQFAQAFDVYLAIRRETARRVATALGRDGPNWRVLNSCPSCTYQLADEEPLEIGGMVAVDGGQSLKRSAAAGHADERTLESDYRIPPAHFDLYANEVAQRWHMINESGEPGDDALTPSVCSQRWKNAKAEHFKTAPGLFEQTGIFPCLCRHGIVLWYTEMVRSGELAKYGLGIVSRMLSVGLRNRYIGYDIGCAFQGTLSRSSLGTRARIANIIFGLNSFHGYGHNRLCQLKHHPVYRKGFGLEDLEICERFFSAANAVAALVRHASHFHYIQFIDLFLAQWDSDKYGELSECFIYNNVVQAYRIIAEMAATVKAFQDTTGYTDAQIEGWLTEERTYLENLKTEPERDILEMDYVEHLEELAELESQLRACHVAIRVGLPLPPLSARQIEREDLSDSAVRKLNKKRQDTYKKFSTAHDTVVALETALGIDERWRPESEQFIAAKKKIIERKWRQALDRLEFLMVQHMFELAKSHAFGTAIGKGLKARSPAIRTAVTKYNSAAVALTPPAPQVDFGTLMEWTQLQEFELLRHTCGGDFTNRAWAQPANRLMAMKFHKVPRAREELLRCRVEMRRLVTAMDDDEAQMRTVLAGLSASNDLLAHELREVMQHRISVNEMHRRRFDLLARCFPAFADCLTPGTPLEHRYGSAARERVARGEREHSHDNEEEDEGQSDHEDQALHAIEDFFVDVD
ncbi:hypothetical protein AURDEDRAFT_74039 [Auricularia subglabra TFB-10046 SS5]|nr:hypothetical protein AURDEDRAFT_74039 [Auricularia subglabra TFB-10046 SS5]